MIVYLHLPFYFTVFQLVAKYNNNHILSSPFCKVSLYWLIYFSIHQKVTLLKYSAQRNLWDLLLHKWTQNCRHQKVCYAVNNFHSEFCILDIILSSSFGVSPTHSSTFINISSSSQPCLHGGKNLTLWKPLFYPSVPVFRIHIMTLKTQGYDWGSQSMPQPELGL